MSLAIDHVILGATDLDVESRALLQRYGLASHPGGRHPGHGTCNHIVPLGDDYLELMAVVEITEAWSSPMGRWVIESLAAGRRLLALALRVDDIEATAQRLGCRVHALSRARPDGRLLRCRLAGIEGAFGPDRLPFFIQWEVPPELHPGRDPAPHRTEVFGIRWVELGGNPALLEAWIGEHRLDLRITEGEPGPRAVGVRTANQEIELR